jgi:hypothetical protein
MISKTRSVRFAELLAMAAELRSDQVGYDSWNEYIWGLVVYDLTVQGPHQVTLRLSKKLTAAERDALHAELYENTKNGIAKRGQYLLKFLKKHGLVESDGEAKPASNNNLHEALAKLTPKEQAEIDKHILELMKKRVSEPS